MDSLKIWMKVWMGAFLLALLVLFEFPLVYSIGVYPSLKVFEYEENNSQTNFFTSSFFVRNDEKEPYEVEVSVDGELKPFVHLTPEKAVIEAGSEKEFKYSLNITSQKLEPGRHEAIFYFRAVPLRREGTNEIPQVQASLRLVAKAAIDIPFPGQYLYLVVGKRISDNEGELKVNILFYNRGKENVPLLNCSLTTTDAAGVARKCSASLRDVAKGQDGILNIKCNGDFPIGKYPVFVSCSYWKNKKVFETSAIVEGKEVEANDFELKRDEYSLSVRNLAHYNFSTVYAKVKILDEKNNTLMEFNTPATSLPERSKKQISGVLPKAIHSSAGNFSALVEVFADGKPTKFMLSPRIRISRRENVVPQNISSLGLVKEEKGQLIWIFVLIVLLIISFIIVLSIVKGNKEDMYF